MRAVLDPNVIISATLSPRGSPARVIGLWLKGAYDIVCSPLLLAELERALAYPKLSRHIHPDEATELVELLRRGAFHADDPEGPVAATSADPDDDYLIALAATANAMLVSGDGDLLALAGQIPVYSPAEFVALLNDQI